MLTGLPRVVDNHSFLGNDKMWSRSEICLPSHQYSDWYAFAPTGYVTLDCDGKILIANPTPAAMLDIERQHLLQASLSNFVNRQS